MMELKKPFWKSFNNPIVWVSLFAIACLIPILTAPEESPNPLTIKIRALTTLFCLLLLIRAISISLISGHPINSRFVAKTVASIFVIRFGPSILNDLYLQSKEHIETSIAIGLSICAVFAFGRISDLLERFLDSLQDWTWKNQKKTVGEEANDSEIAWLPKLLTAEDIHIASIHEAGHALVLAALPNIPDGFCIETLPKPNKGRLGSITSVDWGGVLRPKDFVQIQMLCLLAGQQAEKFIFNEHFDGASRDLRHWQQEAKNFLKSGFGELYFSPVENDYEAEQNRLTLGRLRDEQGDLLSRFFKANQEVLQDLAKELQTQGKLLKSDVEPFLLKVQLVDGFPNLSLED